MQCPACSAENPAAKKFCGDCGAPLANLCPQCRAENPPGKRFCGECGTALSGDKPPAAKQAEGERRHLTVLFCDLVGSTEISSRLDPEVWHAIASEYQRVAAAAVARFGGHVSKFLGDGLVVLFGYPSALEDAAARAVRAGLAIVDAMQALNTRFADHDVALQVRVGIHSGSVVVAQGGGSEADMFGDAPNIAARVQTAAEPDSVFITDATHKLVSGLFTVEDRGTQALKGVSKPPHLYRIAGSDPSRRRAARDLTPFVGRNDETDTLARRWQRVRDGEGQVVLMMGEPGIGKSRLLAEFRARIANDAHLWVECAAEQLFNNTPFHAVVQLLDQGLDWAGQGETPAARLEASLRATGARLDEALPLIAELGGIALGTTYPASKYAPELKRRRLFSALASWVFGAARLRPLVLVVEDLHWADPSTLDVLQVLAGQGDTVPLMLLCTSRPEFRSPWPMRAHHSQLTLNRLSDGQTRELVAGIATRSGLSPDIIDSVIKRTDGVPLFAEALAQLMQDGQGAALQIPVTLQDSLTARLDRLGAARDVAQLAAVIGRDFSYELLSTVSAIDEGALQAALTQLADAELILARGFPPDATYQFKHALVRDAAYDALLKSRRAELHGRIAEAIVEKFPDLAQRQPQLLARHWTEAGRIEPAIAAWSTAAEAADARSAFREAEEAYRQARALLLKLPETAERDARESEMMVPFMVVTASTRSWGSAEVDQLSARARVLAERSGNLMQLVLQSFGQAMSAVSSGELARSRALADQLFDLAKREGSDFSLRCALEAQLLSRYAVGDFKGTESHYAAWLALCERAGFGPFPGETTNTFGTAATAAWHLGLGDTARERAARGIAYGRQSANPTDLATALERATSLYQIEKNPERVMELATEGRTLAGTHGLTSSAHTFDTRLAWARAHLGHAAQSAVDMKAHIALDYYKEKPASVADVVFRLAIILNLAGETHEAFAMVERYLRDYPEARNAQPSALQLRGVLHLKRGEPDAAASDFRAAMALAREIGTRSPELRAATSLARLMHERGETEDARALLAPLYAAFTEGFDSTDLREAKAMLDELGWRDLG